MSNCQWCGDSFNHLPNCPVIEVNTLKARVAELDAEKRVSASEIEYLNSMNRIWKASGLMVIVIALLLRILHV